MVTAAINFPRTTLHPVHWSLGMSLLILMTVFAACNDSGGVGRSDAEVLDTTEVVRIVDRRGYRLDTVWIIDQSSDPEAILSKLQAASVFYPPPLTATGDVAVVISRAKVGPPPKPPTAPWLCSNAPSFWRMSNYCNERSDLGTLAQYFDCAIRGKSAFRTSLGPLDAIEDFLDRNVQRADGRHFTDESSRLHFVIVTGSDD